MTELTGLKVLKGLKRLNRLNSRTGALQAQIALARAGAVAALAGLLLALGLGGWLLLLSQPRLATDTLQATLARAQARLRAPALEAPRDAATEKTLQQTPLQAFHAVLGEPAATEAYVGQLFAAARRHEISLDQAEYRWQVDTKGQTERYQIRLPIKGPYAAVRGFCEQVLRDLPFASLDELSLKRDALADDTLTATVQFSLHLHPGAASAAVAVPAAAVALKTSAMTPTLTATTATAMRAAP